MPSLHFRKSAIGDSDTITDFQVAMAFETEAIALDRDACRRGVLKVFQTQPAFGKYHVCEIDGEVVASMLVLSEWSDWRNGEVWWIHSVYVKPEHRRRKIFSRMYSYLKDLMQNDESVRGLRLYVEKHNETAQKVYAHLGMSKDRYDLYEWMKEF